MNKQLDFIYVNITPEEEQDQMDAQDAALGKPKYDKSNPPKHAGLFFRGYNHVYWDGQSYAHKRGYKLLKRKSCKGCPTCDFIFDDCLPTEVQDVEDIGVVKHGKLYELVVHKDNGSYEYPDDISVWTEFNEVKEDK